MTLVRPVLLLACFLVLACGDAVTNPALDGFEADPRPIQGDWVTIHDPPNDDRLLLPAEIVPAGGRLLGSFEFNRFGSFWKVQFNDATWDGTRMRFTVQMTIDGSTVPVQWTATFFPRESGEPPRLLLASDPFGGSAAPIEYLRPRDVEAR